MLKIEKTVLPSPEQWEIIIEGMRNPKNSWDRMDSRFHGVRYLMYSDNEPMCFIDEEGQSFVCDQFIAGPNDHKLMTNLAKGGPVHAKYRRMIPVYVTINAPLYWWKEFDTYKVGTVCNSCSTMHKIQEKEFTPDDFSCEHLFDDTEGIDTKDWYYDTLLGIIDALNTARESYLTSKEKRYWWQMIQLLPTSYNQKRTIMLNYEVLVGIYRWRKNHKLDEWHTFCDWIEQLPYSELITGNGVE